MEVEMYHIVHNCPIDGAGHLTRANNALHLMLYLSPPPLSLVVGLTLTNKKPHKGKGDQIPNYCWHP
jgi:hypothetical protein